MLDLAPGWELSVERGPDWLFVRVANPNGDAEEAPPLAERLSSLLQQHLTDRLVLELDRIDILRSYLIGQLVLLHQHLSQRGGVLRLAGLSPRNRKVLETCQLAGRFPDYRNRMDAVWCRSGAPAPVKPR